MKNKKTVYLIGAGFSKELFNTPTSQRFFNEEDFKDNKFHSSLREFINQYYKHKNPGSLNLEEVDGFIEWKIEISSNEEEKKHLKGIKRGSKR